MSDLTGFCGCKEGGGCDYAATSACGAARLQTAVYCGLPAANHAYAVAQRVLDER